MDIQEIVEAVLSDLNEEEKTEILEAGNSDLLVCLHPTLGQYIRNEFNLWSNKWTPDIVNGVDISPQHPDALSQIIIHEIYKQLKEAN